MTERVKELINEGIAYMQAADYEAAENVFQKVLEEDKKCVAVYMHLGNALVSQMKLDEGMHAFKTALMMEPESGLIYFNLGSVSFLKDDWAGAIKYLNQAEEKGYKSEELFMLKAGIFSQSEDYLQAIREVSKAICIKPLKVDLYQRKASLQLQAGHLESAIETMEELRELVPDAYEGYELGIRLYCSQEEYEKAMQLAEDGAERFPEDSSFPYLKMKIFRAKKEYEKVKALADQIIDMNIGENLLRDTIICKAEACGYLGQAEEMKQVLEEFNTKVQDVQVMYMLLLIYSGEKRHDKVKEISLQMQNMDVEKYYIALAKFSYVQALEQTDGIEHARESYAKLAKEFRTLTIQNPEMYEVYIYRVLCHAALEEYGKALELTDYLEKAYPELADGHLYKYYVYNKMGNTQEAQREKEKALEINPNIKVQW